MRPRVLVTREVFDATLEYLAAHCEVESNQAHVPFDPGTLARPAQSMRAPESLITFAYLAMSEAIWRTNRSAGPPNASAPRLTSFAFTSGRFNTRLTSALSLDSVDVGVPAAVMSPYQGITSNPATPDSIMVGISGIAGERPGVVTASPRSFPPRTCWTAAGMFGNT